MKTLITLAVGAALAAAWVMLFKPRVTYTADGPVESLNDSAGTPASSIPAQPSTAPF